MLPLYDYRENVIYPLILVYQVRNKMFSRKTRPFYDLCVLFCQSLEKVPCYTTCRRLYNLLAHMYDAQTELGEGDWVHSRLGFPNFIKYFAFCTEHVVTKVALCSALKESFLGYSIIFTFLFV